MLTTTAATRAQELATTDGCFTRKEAVAPHAHKIAGLKSPHHFVLEYLVRLEARCVVRLGSVTGKVRPPLA